MYIAPQARLLLTDTSEVGVNLGTLVRRYSADMDRVFGVYGFYDHDNSAEGFEYSQFGFGFDTLGEVVDFRANAYLPTTEDVNFVRALRINPNDPIFFGNSLGFMGVGLFQEAVSGGDFEFGIPLTKRTPWLRGYAGAYAYEAEKNSPVGVRGRIEAWIKQRPLGGGQRHRRQELRDERQRGRRLPVLGLASHAVLPQLDGPRTDDDADSA
jgi:trimeric autotransporter adhesin